MEHHMEKRACERWNHTVLIAFSYFNQEPSFILRHLTIVWMVCVLNQVFPSNLTHPFASE